MTINGTHLGLMLVLFGAGTVHAQATVATRPAPEPAPAPAPAPAQQTPPAPPGEPTPSTSAAATPTASTPVPVQTSSPARAGTKSPTAATEIIDIPAEQSESMSAGSPTGSNDDLTPHRGEPQSAVKTHVRAATQRGPESSGDSDDRQLLPWTFTGVAVVLGMSGAVVGLDAMNKYDELDENCTRPCPESRIKSLTTRSLVADVLYAGAGASVITAVVLFLLEDPSHEAKTQNTGALPAGELSLTPVVGNGLYGALGGLRF